MPAVLELGYQRRLINVRAFKSRIASKSKRMPSIVFASKMNSSNTTMGITHEVTIMTAKVSMNRLRVSWASFETPCAVVAIVSGMPWIKLRIPEFCSEFASSLSCMDCA
ncbi:MAG: hypothetical protein IJ125_02910 [Atopobiaceae bacterium]|nr:hypothetical protein [Atopobiaceae bacterium]